LERENNFLRYLVIAGAAGGRWKCRSGIGEQMARVEKQQTEPTASQIFSVPKIVKVSTNARTEAVTRC